MARYPDPPQDGPGRDRPPRSVLRRWTSQLAVAALAGGLAGAASADALPALPEGRTWKLVWNDEFDGEQIDPSKWVVLGDKARRKGWWLRSQASLNGKGSLILRTERTERGFASGGIETEGKYEKAFGYFVIRCRLPRASGHWPAFWLMTRHVLKVGDGGTDGTEVDIFEAPWLDRDEVNHALHWDGYGEAKKKARFVAPAPGLREGFHTFGLWWTPEQYRFYVDGRLTWTTREGGVSQVPQHLMITEEIGAFAERSGGSIERAELPDDFEVDYVRVYDEMPR